MATVRNQILQSPSTGAYYFITKGEDLGDGITRVTGRKVDVTESIQRLFGPALMATRERLKKPTKPRQKSRRSHIR